MSARLPGALFAAACLAVPSWPGSPLRAAEAPTAPAQAPAVSPPLPPPFPPAPSQTSSPAPSRLLAPADALLAVRADAAAARAYEALGPQASPKRESWRQNNWGLALLRLGRPARAVVHFRAAVRADRLNYIARANLGAAYEQVGDLTKALSVYRRALLLLRSRTRGQSPRGEAAREDGETLAPTPGSAAAPGPAERPCVLAPAALKTALARAGALLSAGRYAEARDAYAAIGRVQAAAREGWRLNNWGLCDLRLARPDLARERLERSVAVLPSNPTAWNNLAVADEQLGLEGEAAAAFAKGAPDGRGGDPQRLELVKVKLEFSSERRRWEASR